MNGNCEVNVWETTKLSVAVDIRKMVYFVFSSACDAFCFHF